ncbi:hypothetical protein [Pseudoduganella sp. GCM10020061]|uniref:hypothetical protein n=1 Tax=Pseudoduganella sp. GCM10020061 TaxID=3317345 RepID=UPI00364425DF
MTQRSKKLLKVTSKSIYVAPLFYLIVGAVFLAEGLGEEDQSNFATITGAAIGIFGLAVLWINLRAFRGQLSSRS